MDLDRLQAAIKLILDALLGRRLDYLALYPCKVVGQSGNTVEVVPDDPRIPGTTGVPVYSGTPGTTSVIPDGTRVLLGFEGGNPRSPYVALWGTLSPKPTSVTLEADSEATIDATSIKLGKNALLGVARLGDTVQAGPFSGVITSASLRTKAE